MPNKPTGNIAAFFGSTSKDGPTGTASFISVKVIQVKKIMPVEIINKNSQYFSPNLEIPDPNRGVAKLASMKGIDATWPASSFEKANLTCKKLLKLGQKE